MMQKLSSFLCSVVTAAIVAQAEAGLTIGGVHAAGGQTAGGNTIGKAHVVEVGEEEFGDVNPPVDEGIIVDDEEDEAPSSQMMMDAPGNAHVMGHWSPAYNWPLCPIHAILMKNGKVLTFGTNPEGNGASGFTYDVWDPILGLTPNSHQTMDITTNTNIFCAGCVNLPDGAGGHQGEVLIVGGSEHVGDIKNLGIKATQCFDPDTNAQFLDTSNPMFYARWYPSMTTLGNGNIFVQGGRDEDKKPTEVPELYNVQTGRWTDLPEAISPGAYRLQGWWYPKAYLGNDGSVVIVPPNRTKIYNIWPEDNTPPVVKTNFPRGDDDTPHTRESPSVMYDKDKVLIFQDAKDVLIMDMSDPQEPTVRPTGSLYYKRNWANTVALPNGEVLVVGGTQEENYEEDAVFEVEIWNPRTEVWRRGAVASKSRLYHSTALLLPDATVLVGGGGPPGSVVNQNAEIYYPPYLFKKDGSGDLADRPEIDPLANSQVVYGQSLPLTVDGSVVSVVLIRLGSVTHSFNMEERVLYLSYSLTMGGLRADMPTNPNEAPPGFYHIFVVDDEGVPSKSVIVSLMIPP